MALTREQAKAFYDKAVEAGYSDEEITAELKKRSGAPAAAPASVEAEPEGIKVKMQKPLEVMEQQLQGNPAERFMAGLNRSTEGLTTGARKLLAQFTGGDADKYSNQEQQTRQLFEKYDPTGSGFSVTDAGRMTGDLLGAAPLASAGVGLGGAAALGAGYGALQPTVEGESQGFNALMGGLGGVAGHAAGTGIAKLGDMVRRTDAPDALADFVERQLGATRGGDTSGQYSAITDAVENQRGRLMDEFARRYSNVEGAASQPVSMGATSRLSDEALSLPEEVMNSLNPGARRTMEALRRGTVNTSPIVDAAGNNIQSPRDVGFRDVRDTVRALRQARRALPRTDAGVARGQQLGNLVERLDQDLDAWGSMQGMGPGNADILRGARQVDADYAQQLAPFNSKDSIIGQLRRGSGDEGAINRMFLGNDKGQAVSELLDRVPGTEEPARALYGQRLLQERGDTPMIRQLEGGTTAERLLTPDERAYTTALADNLRQNKSRGMLDLRTLLKGVAHTPVIDALGGGKIDKMTTGILPYGAQEIDPTIIQQLLRVLSVQPAAGE